MARPKVGSDYRLNIGRDLRDDPIAWVNNSSRRLYSTWDEIDGKIVRVKGVTRVIPTFYIVALLERSKDSFYTPRKLLMELTRRLPIPCTCELSFLLNCGCNCGAFKKEQTKKNR